MNAALPPILAQALAPFAPPQSAVHQVLREAIDPAQLNDDDWYQIRDDGKLIQNCGFYQPIVMPDNYQALTGLQIKCRGINLWRERVHVEHVNPPIPMRDHDYRATRDGYEPGDPIGYGPTEAAAEEDLTERQALDQAIGRLVSGFGDLT